MQSIYNRTIDEPLRYLWYSQANLPVSTKRRIHLNIFLSTEYPNKYQKRAPPFRSQGKTI